MLQSSLMNQQSIGNMVAWLRMSVSSDPGKEECMHQQRNTRPMFALAVATFVISLCVATFAQTGNDNSKVNARDGNKQAATSDQQKENASDRKLTQDIRRALTQDKSLSSYAHNVKVITRGGQVTLKGPVRTEDEKRLVEAKATEVAGAGHVSNEISIAAKDSKKH
jgi:hyperosmotically inducible protein